MSNNETLIAPIPIADVSDMQAVSMPMAEELAYTYQRADGTVERARNAEDAIARCPVLGKLAIEAPDQASILLELAAAGNAKIAAEVKKEPKQPTTQEAHPEPKPAKAVELEKKVPEISVKQIAKTELPVIASEPVDTRQPVIKVGNTASYHADIERLELNRQGTLTAIESVVAPNTGVAVESEKQKVKAPQKDSTSPELTMINKAEPVQPFEISSNEGVDSAPLINVEVEQRHKQDTEPQKNEVVIIESSETTAISDELVDTLDLEYETTDTEMSFWSEDLEVPVITLSMDNDSSTELVNHEVEAALDENMKQLFETETIETYHELRDLIAEPVVKNTVSAVNIESETEGELEPVESLTFEAFVATQTVSEEVTIENIIEQSNEQPLEKTLVQLVEYMSDYAEDDEQLEPLLAIIKVLEKSLPKHNFALEAEEIKLQISPEITDNLLMLLRELGYQNPREVLVSMVNRFGYTFLLRSLTYLFQLADEDKCIELLIISTPAPSSDDSPHSRLGNLVFKLITTRNLALNNGTS